MKAPALVETEKVNKSSKGLVSTAYSRYQLQLTSQFIASSHGLFICSCQGRPEMDRGFMPICSTSYSMGLGQKTCPFIYTRYPIRLTSKMRHQQRSPQSQASGWHSKRSRVKALECGVAQMTQHGLNISPQGFSKLRSKRTSKENIVNFSHMWRFKTHKGIG